MNAQALKSLAEHLRLDVVTLVMLLVVGCIGFVIVRYSRTYLDGAPGLGRYFRSLFGALGAVTCLVVSRNMLVMVCAWAATSLAVHRLLTFHVERPEAIIAAHKKFLVSRLADLCLVPCAVLVYREVGSWDLDRIDEWTREHPGLSPSMHAAAVLLVLAVALRSAQLPFHGWLLQVMEAPTPVSALLHAGVVNVGGFVMIRLAPWMNEAAPARGLLLAIGLVTAVVATLVTTTRVSVKVALAWSTCAQMGFMLVECALGAWHLALLHLAAHSFYKAYAFLSAGGAVERWRASESARAPRSSRTDALVFLGAVGAAVGVGAAAGRLSVGVLALVLGLSVGPALLQPGGWSSALSVVALSSCGHLAALRLMPQGAASTAESPWGWALVGTAFAGLFVVKAHLQHRPTAPLPRLLYPWLFAGLHLDEIFTRRAFRIWPPRVTRRAGRTVTGVVAPPKAVEA